MLDKPSVMWGETRIWTNSQRNVLIEVRSVLNDIIKGGRKIKTEKIKNIV